MDRRAFLKRLGGVPEPVLNPVAVVTPGCFEARGVACRVCETACDSAAIRFRPRPGGRTAVEIEAARCSGCGDCLSVCPAGAIALAPAPPNDNSSELAS